MRRWKNLERQRPSLRFVRWGEIAGLALFGAGIAGLGTLVLGLVVMAGFGLWGWKVLNE